MQTSIKHEAEQFVVLGKPPLVQEVDTSESNQNHYSIWLFYNRSHTQNLKSIHALGAEIFPTKMFPIIPYNAKKES